MWREISKSHYCKTVVTQNELILRLSLEVKSWILRMEVIRGRKKRQRNKDKLRLWQARRGQNALAWQTLKFQKHDWTLSCAFSFSLKVLLLHPHPLSITSILKIQDSTSRLDLKINLFRSPMFYSSDFCWSPFALNVRELSYLKNLVHPGTVYSTSSVDSNPSSNSFIDHLLCFGTLYIAREANLQLPSFPNLLYWLPLLSFVHYALHRLILFPINPLIHL